MFQQAVIRLTIWYTAAVILLSFGFSYALYQASTHELTQLETRQEDLIEGSHMMLPPGYSEFNQRRIDQIEESKHNIAIALGYFNFFIILLGAAGAYLLAKRTLQPIEESVAAQDRFTSDASHELRTPLTAIKTEIEVALRDKAFTLKEARELNESTLQEVAKLEALTNGLLKLAKHDSEIVVRQSIPLEKVVSTVCDRIAHLANANGVSVEQDVHGNVIGEEWALIELVTILLDNAIKYSPKGTVSIKTIEERGYVTLTVADTGMGIKASELPHVFERFYRADTSRSKNKIDGYGLGLSIAQKIVENHHGKISVTSTVDKGSVFSVRLPSAVSQQSAVA